MAGIWLAAGTKKSGGGGAGVDTEERGTVILPEELVPGTTTPGIGRQGRRSTRERIPSGASKRLQPSHSQIQSRTPVSLISCVYYLSISESTDDSLVTLFSVIFAVSCRACKRNTPIVSALLKVLSFFIFLVKGFLELLDTVWSRPPIISLQTFSSLSRSGEQVRGTEGERDRNVAQG